MDREPPIWFARLSGKIAADRCAPFLFHRHGFNELISQLLHRTIGLTCILDSELQIADCFGRWIACLPFVAVDSPMFASSPWWTASADVPSPHSSDFYDVPTWSSTYSSHKKRSARHISETLNPAASTKRTYSVSSRASRPTLASH